MSVPPSLQPGTFRWCSSSLPAPNKAPGEAADESTLHLFSASLRWIFGRFSLWNAGLTSELSCNINTLVKCSPSKYKQTTELLSDVKRMKGCTLSQLTSLLIRHGVYCGKNLLVPEGNFKLAREGSRRLLPGAGSQWVTREDLMSTEIVSRINLLQVSWEIRTDPNEPKNKGGANRYCDSLTEICLKVTQETPAHLFAQWLRTDMPVSPHPWTRSGLQAESIMVGKNMSAGIWGNCQSWSRGAWMWVLS